MSFCDNALTTLNERKRFREEKDDDDMDTDETGMSKIRMKPDILSYYRTPGAFKFCRRISSRPLVDHFHKSNRGSPLPENVLIEVLSYLNKRDLCSAMAKCRLLYVAGSRCTTWEHVYLFDRRSFRSFAHLIS